MGKRSLVLPLTVLGLGLAVLAGVFVALLGVILGWSSLFGIEHPKRELARLKATYATEITEYRLMHDAAVEELRGRVDTARMALSADGAIGPDWEWYEAINSIDTGYDGELLAMLAKAYLSEPNAMFEAHGGELSDELESLREFPERLTTFEREVLNTATDSCALRAWFENYVFDLPLAAELEEALLKGVIDLRLWDPKVAKDPEYFSKSVAALRLLEVRVLAHGLRGDENRAVDLLARLYGATRDALKPALLQQQVAASLKFLSVDKVLWGLLPAIEWTPERVSTIGDALQIAPETPMKILRVAAATPSEGMFESIGFSADSDIVALQRYAVADSLAGAFAESPTSFKNACETVKGRFESESSVQHVFGLLTTGMTQFVSEWHAQDVVRAAELLAELLQRDEMFTVALQLEHYRREHGEYPGTLDEVESEEELFSFRWDKPLAYERDGKGYRLVIQGKEPVRVVWSVPGSGTCEEDIP